MIAAGRALHSAILLFWLPLLVGLQSIPGTGALRTLVLVIGLVHVLLWARQQPLYPLDVRGRVEIALFFSLSAWLCLQSAWLAPTPVFSLLSLGEEWVKLLLMILLGLNVARLSSDLPQRIALALFAGSFLHVISTLAKQAVAWHQSGSLAFGESLLGNYGYASPFTSAALTWLLADLASRYWLGKRLLPWPLGITLFLAAMSLLAEFFLSAKAGQIMILVLSLTLLVLYLRHGRHPVAFTRARLFALAVLIVVALSAFIHTGNQRWRGAEEAILSAWSGEPDIQTFIGSNDPASNVNRLDPSFYLRMVWARMALEGLAAHPWGLGYGADAFGRYVSERYGISGAISSHSGWLDFALANGLLGLCLLLLLSYSLMVRGWRAFIAGQPAGIALMLYVLHYIGRASFDGILAGSRLMGFALVASALWYLSIAKDAHRSD